MRCLLCGGTPKSRHSMRESMSSTRRRSCVCQQRVRCGSHVHIRLRCVVKSESDEQDEGEDMDRNGEETADTKKWAHITPSGWRTDAVERGSDYVGTAGVSAIVQQ